MVLSGCHCAMNVVRSLRRGWCTKRAIHRYVRVKSSPDVVQEKAKNGKIRCLFVSNTLFSEWFASPFLLVLHYSLCYPSHSCLQPCLFTDVWCVLSILLSAGLQLPSIDVTHSRTIPDVQNDLKSRIYQNICDCDKPAL